jgi:diadenosine tetraphosphate (Ap4A) HIT family hydrolase
VSHLQTTVECWSCLSNSGHRRISPAAPIHVGQFWQVEHAYPTQLRGWLVIVLRRHVEALHQVTSDEFRELALVLERTVHALRAVVGCEKEYVACYGELEHFNHVHFHVVARAADMPAHLLGAKSFALLQVSGAGAVQPAEVRTLCESLSAAIVGAAPNSNS